MMPTADVLEKLQAPSYIVGANGRPVAVVVDLVTWRAILERLENMQDLAILRSAARDLALLTAGQTPDDWKSWEDVVLA